MLMYKAPVLLSVVSDQALNVSINLKLLLELQNRSYASLANEDKILAEGTFDCDSGGHATFEWKRAIQFTDVWNVLIDMSSLVKEVNLTDGRSITLVYLLLFIISLIF